MCAHAEFDSAVARQLRSTDMPLPMVISLIAGMRQDRAPVAEGVLAPLRLEAGVNRLLEPLVGVFRARDGARLGRWSPGAGRGHALDVLRCVDAVDLDGAYRRFLVGQVGVPAGTAEAMVGDLAKFRDLEESPPAGG